MLVIWAHKQAGASWTLAVEQGKLEAGMLVYRFMAWGAVFQEALFDNALNKHFGHCSHPVPAIHEDSHRW